MLYYNYNINNVKNNFLVFDGVNDYVIVEPFSSPPIRTAFSFFCRLEFDEDNKKETIFSSLNGGINGIYIVKNERFNNNLFLGFMGGGAFFTGIITQTRPQVNQVLNLHFISQNSSDINTLKLYINGQPVATDVTGSNYATSNPTANNKVVIGKEFANGGSSIRRFKGKMYNQSIVNYAKTLAEIQADNANKKQSLDATKGQYLYNAVFNQLDNVTTFQTQEAAPKTVTIFR